MKFPTYYFYSAGVGRTGTFIAVDQLLQHLKQHQYVDIFGLVHEMRNQRTLMVQTEVSLYENFVARFYVHWLRLTLSYSICFL